MERENEYKTRKEKEPVREEPQYRPIRFEKRETPAHVRLTAGQAKLAYLPSR